MVRDRLSVSDVDDGFLLDGNPRTTAQVDYLDGILAEGGQSVDVVLQLTADDEELVAYGFWAVRRNLDAATTMRRSSATAWTSTVSRPRPLWPRTPSAAS
ncbi:adenylate kinase family enzyme [Arthrobacter oryzae]|nr:adenylate kinase family enzyme [Arthrobacter oryzae]